MVRTLTFSWPIPLPFEMGYVGMPGCYLLQSNDVFGLPATQVAAGTLSYSESIPFNPYLLGAHLYLQAYAYAPGVNAAQIIASNPDRRDPRLPTRSTRCRADFVYALRKYGLPRSCHAPCTGLCAMVSIP